MNGPKNVKEGVAKIAVENPMIEATNSPSPHPIRALAWKYGGTFLLSPSVILTADSFDSYTNFVRLQEESGVREGARVSRDLFRFEEPRHRLPRAVLDHFAARWQPGGRNLTALSDEDWTRLVESHCGRKLAKVCRNIIINLNIWVLSVYGGS